MEPPITDRFAGVVSSADPSVTLLACGPSALLFRSSLGAVLIACEGTDEAGTGANGSCEEILGVGASMLSKSAPAPAL